MLSLSLVVCDLFGSWTRWRVMSFLCNSLYKRFEGIELPSKGVETPTEAFEDTRVYGDYARFTIFVVWSKINNPCGFWWYRKIEIYYPYQVPTILHILGKRLRLFTALMKKKISLSSLYGDLGVEGSFGGRPTLRFSAKDPFQSSQALVGTRFSVHVTQTST